MDCRKYSGISTTISIGTAVIQSEDVEELLNLFKIYQEYCLPAVKFVMIQTIAEYWRNRLGNRDTFLIFHALVHGSTFFRP